MIYHIRILDDCGNMVMEINSNFELKAKASGFWLKHNGVEHDFTLCAMVKLVDSYHGETAWSNSTEVVATIDLDKLSKVVELLTLCKLKDFDNKLKHCEE